MMQHGLVAFWVRRTSADLSLPQASPADHLPRNTVQQFDGVKVPCASTDLDAQQAHLVICEGEPQALHVNGPAFFALLLQIQDALGCSADLLRQLSSLKQTQVTPSQQAMRLESMQGLCPNMKTRPASLP